MRSLLFAFLAISCGYLSAQSVSVGQWELRKRNANGTMTSYGVTAENGKAIGFTADVPAMLAVGGSLTIGSSTITSGTSGRALYNNNGTLGQLDLASLYQPLATNLTSIGALANSAGLLRNNGSGTFTYLATTTGGNGETDSGKVPLYNGEGGLALGSYDNTNGNTLCTMRLGMGTALAVGLQTFGYGIYSELNGTGSVAFHGHVAASATGDNIAFQGDVTGGTGVNYLLQGVARSTGYLLHGYEYDGSSQHDRLTIDAQGDVTWYKNGTTLTTGTDKTILTYATPSGTSTLTLPATTGTLLTTGDTGSVTSTMILDGTIANGDLAGSIALSKLALTGTPDGTKFLRDDGTWQAISLSGYLPLSGGTMTGPLAITAGTASTSTAPISLTQTWNGGSGVTHRGIEVAITNTSSGAASTYLRIMGGASATTHIFSVDKNGWLNGMTGASMVIAPASGQNLALYPTGGAIVAFYTSMSLPNGSAAWPIVAFTGNGSGTGIYSSAANTLDFSTGSSRRMTIKNTTINFANLPTSAAGLSSGDLWNDSGTVKIVP